MQDERVRIRGGSYCFYFSVGWSERCGCIFGCIRVMDPHRNEVCPSTFIWIKKGALGAWSLSFSCFLITVTQCSPEYFIESPVLWDVR